MLNRLFIVVGTLAIVVMVAAFIVPRYYDWNPYRARLEAMASEALGTPIQIRGDLKLTILPQPRLTLNDVVVGRPEAPVARAATVEAEFELMEFLRDRYQVSDLRIEQPVFALRVDEAGQLVAPVNLPRQVSTNNVAIRNATISGGTVTLSDGRTGERWSATEVEASLRLTALRGPFSVQGTGLFDGASYQVRLNSSDPNEDGEVRLSVFLRPAEGRFTVSADGILTPGGGQPKFSGSLGWRYTPPQGDDVSTVRGAAVLDAKVEADPERLLLSSFTYLPDETLASARFTGAAEVDLGADPHFDAVVSGGVIGLFQPREVREETLAAPYALLELIDALPAPPATTLPGRVGFDITELNLSGLSLRDVRVDTRTDGEAWQVAEFSGRLAGETTISLAGRASAVAGKPSFEGAVSFTTQRLDALARLWSPATEDNPLFGIAGTLAARVTMDGSGVSLSQGAADIDGNSVGFTAKVTRWPAPVLDVRAELGALDARAGAQLAALMPAPLRDPSFAVSFPQGALEVTAQRFVYRGQELNDFEASASWSADGIEVDRLAVSDAEGTRLTGSGALSGSLGAPHMVGAAELRLAERTRAADLWALVPVPSPGVTVGAPPRLAPLVETILDANRPLMLDLKLEDEASGGQRLAVSMLSGQVRAAGEAQLEGGIFGALTQPVASAFTFEAPDRTALASALGVPPLVAAGLVRGEPASLSWQSSGTISSSLDASIVYTAGAERIGFDGNLTLGDPSAVSGRGRMDLRLSDFAGYADILGLTGLNLPALSGAAEVEFSGLGSVALTEIDAEIAGQRVGGDIALERAAGELNYTGALSVDRVDVSALGWFLGGAASLVPGDGPWPIGPISVGETARGSRGRIAVEAGRLTLDTADLLHGVAFDFVWDGTETRIRELTGALGEGEVRIDARICCATELRDKQLSGRFSVDSVDLDALLPPALARGLGGTIEASGQFAGNGVSYADMVRTLGGDGRFTVEGLTVEEFNPGAFAAIAGMDDILALEPEALAGAVVEALGTGALSVPSLSAPFSIAGGTARVTNLAADGGSVRLLGDGALNLSDFSIDSSFSMTPTGPVGGLLTEASGKVTANVSGPLVGPVAELDVTQMVDALKARAYELEVARLERLRAEQEARIRAASVAEQRRLANLYLRRAIEQREAAAREAVRLAEAAIARQIARPAAALPNEPALPDPPIVVPDIKPEIVLPPPDQLPIELLPN